MPKNSCSTLLFCPPSVAIHDNGYMTRQIIDVDIFLKRGHKGAKIAYFSNFSQDGAITQKCQNPCIGTGFIYRGW
jgi:hypothetical protein